jgi:hypothetical protein
MERVVVSHSDDGSTFKDLFALARGTSVGTKEFPAFRGYEDRGNELLRFFCFAEPEAKERYLEILRANREMLREEKRG